MKKFLLALLILPINLWGSPNNLSPSQLTTLENGGQIITEVPIEGNPWPQFTVYQYSKANPSTVAALFWDFERDPSYIPNCISAKTAPIGSPLEKTTTFHLKMPMFLPDEVYSSDQTINGVPHTMQSYDIKWTVTSARYITSCTGHLSITPNGTGSLLTYHNLVNPGARIAGMLRENARTQVAETVEAIVKESEKIESNK